MHSQFSEVPSDEIVSAGNNLTITCVYPNATSISWEKDGSPVSSGHQFSVTPLPSEPDGSTLTLIEASVPTHNGSYECIADLDGGQRMATEFSVVVACEYLVLMSIQPNVSLLNDSLFLFPHPTGPNPTPPPPPPPKKNL